MLQIVTLSAVRPNRNCEDAKEYEIDSFRMTMLLATAPATARTLAAYASN